jgi:hypothetical protein
MIKPNFIIEIIHYAYDIFEPVYMDAAHTHTHTHTHRHTCEISVFGSRFLRILSYETLNFVDVFLVYDASNKRKRRSVRREIGESQAKRQGLTF